LPSPARARRSGATPRRTAERPRRRPGAQAEPGDGRKTRWRMSVMKRVIVAGWLGAVTFACLATAGAQTLPELSATLGVHDSAAANGASTAYGARDTIMRHLPQNSAGGDPWGKGSDT